MCIYLSAYILLLVPQPQLGGTCFTKKNAVLFDVNLLLYKKQVLNFYLQYTYVHYFYTALVLRQDCVLFFALFSDSSQSYLYELSNLPLKHNYSEPRTINDVHYTIIKHFGFIRYVLRATFNLGLLNPVLLTEIQVARQITVIIYSYISVCNHFSLLLNNFNYIFILFNCSIALVIFFFIYIQNISLLISPSAVLSTLLLFYLDQRWCIAIYASQFTHCVTFTLKHTS